MPCCYVVCRQVEVTSAGDVAALMSKGASQRATSETKMNDRSSRSHQILTVIVDGMNSVTKARSHGCLHLIDLAGSERVGKSEASGEWPALERAISLCIYLTHHLLTTQPSMARQSSVAHTSVAHLCLAAGAIEGLLNCSGMRS